LARSERGRSDESAAPSSSGIPAVGEIVASKYRVEAIIGAGAMGIVTVARHMQLGQQVAIKFLRAEAATQNSAMVSRFLREARAAVAIKSEHVARVFDVGTLDSGLPYIVMEFLAGQDLAAAIEERGHFGVEDTVDAVLQAADAIGEAHALGIIHRDLKPSNLFLVKRRDGSRMVKVLDFGISRAPQFGQGLSSNESSLTQTGYIVGSPAYMSPEQIRNAKAVDPRTDVWSLGVILYELLTGTQPFSGESLGEVLAKIVADPAPPIRDANASVPDALANLIAKCLEREPARRVQSIAELAVALRPFASPNEQFLADRMLRGDLGTGVAASSGDTLAAPSDASWDSWHRSHAAAGRRPRVETRAIVVGALVCAVVLTAAAVVVKIRLAPVAGPGTAPSAAAAPHDSKDRTVAAQSPAPAVERQPEAYAASSDAGSEVWPSFDEALDPVKPVPDRRAKTLTVAPPAVARPATRVTPRAKPASIDDLLEGRQ
jgi:serine/threonine-protein kinase